MSEKTKKLLFALIKSALCGTLLDDEQMSLVSKENLDKAYDLARKHDLAHILTQGLVNNKLLDQDTEDFENNFTKAQIFAMYRYERMTHELDNLCKSLESANIDFMPLKGSVIRKYYEKPWLRSSSDIDILIHAEDLEKAISLLRDEASYEYMGLSAHDASFMSPNKTHIELHYDLIEKDSSMTASHILKTVWDNAVLHQRWKHRYEMTEEFFYFYHIAHMAKHFELGGCGIRSIMDLWILDANGEFDGELCNHLLQQSGLLTFSNAIRKLAGVWFENEVSDEITDVLEQYVIKGGVFGNSVNRISVQQQKKGGKIKYALSKIFIPYRSIKFHYPILHKAPWLMPFMQVRRWCKLIFCGHLKRTASELNYNQRLSKESAEKTENMLRSIGLK